MDYPQPDTQITLDEDDSRPDGHTSGFFLRSRQFSVSGGTFTNVTNIHRIAPSDTPDFRVIPLGDLDLLPKRDGGSGIVRRYRRGTASTRRVYTARIPGLQSRVTAAVYQGDGAEEEWREEITRYANLRHPNLVQLYGVVKTQNLHAAVFHDDLIPYKELEDEYCNSHVSTVFFWASLHTTFSNVDTYLHPFLHRELVWSEYTVLIRPSTGHFCIQLAPSESGRRPWGLDTVRLELPVKSLLEPPADSQIIGSLSLEEYHSICYFHLGRWKHFPFSENISVNLGSIRHVRSAQYEDSLEIAFVPDSQVADSGWCTEDPIIGNAWHPFVSLSHALQWLLKLSDRVNCNAAGTLMMENGWIRVNSFNVAEAYKCRICVDWQESISSWLPHANHIFDRLNITRDLGNYVYMDSIDYWLTFSASIDDTPPGYLFLCPSADFESDHRGSFRVPECPAYWSFDPFGAERLTAGEGGAMGFPDIQCHREVWGRFWEDSIYAGIRQFHEAKGFDPHSLEVAVAMGCPLLEMSCDPDALLAHLQQSTSRTLQEYHAICYDNPTWWPPFCIPTNVSVELGSIRYFPSSEYEDSVELAFIPGYQVYDCGWSTRASIAVDVWNPLNCDQEGNISALENGWVRVNSADVAGVYHRRILADTTDSRILSAWLAQANHIFNRLEMTCNLQNYFLIDIVDYWLEFSGPAHYPPLGYLFLCPLDNLQSAPACFRMPDCPAYWSLDPFGAEHLTADEARTLGFPDIQFRMKVWGRCWDHSVYTGIHQFQDAKGFDPYSQEAAIAMGSPLIEIACDRDALLTRINANDAYEESSESDVQEYQDLPEEEDDRESTTGSCDADPPMVSGSDEAGTYGDSVLSDGDSEFDINHTGKGIADSRTLGAEMFAPSRSWNILMSVQFTLLLMLSTFALYDSFCAS